MSEVKYYERRFLNEKEGIAFVEAKNGTFRIGDCSRVVSLDFYLDDDPEYLPSDKDINMIEYKIDSLHAALSDYRRYLKRKIKKIRTLKEQ